jgi:hypothetical protein
VASTDHAENLKNPAGRLYEFLNYCANNGQSNGPLLPVFTGYLELPNDLTPTVFRALADLREQPDLFRREAAAMTSLPIPMELFIGDVDQVDNALARITNFGSQLSELRQHYDAGTLRGLRTASAIFNSASAMTGDIPGDKLGEIRGLVEALVALLTEDDTIDGDLRLLLYRYVDAIRRALDLYKINGIAGLNDVNNLLHGSLHSQPAVVAKVVKNSRLKEVVGGILIALNLVTAFGNSAIAIEGGLDSLHELTAPDVTNVAPPHTGGGDGIPQA